MLLAYLKRQYKLLLLLAGAVCIFAAVFALYDLPLEAVLYAGALCLALGLVLFAVGYSRFLRRHRELQRLLRQAGEKALSLPPARGLLEEDYQTLLQAVCRDRARLAAENESRLRELTDYYSLWVHQIKTPIAAMDLLLQEDDSPRRGELEMELLKIGQYVEMVLSYLRLDSDSTDYVLREYPLDDILRQAVRKFAKMFILKKITLDFQETGKTVLPVYDFSAEKRSEQVEPIDLQGGVCIVEGIHALNPELTGLVKGDDIYRIYAGLREEYCIDGRRVINTQDIRLCRRTLRDAAARGRSPEKTLAMWDRVLDGETRYIKGFKTTADFLLDTSFTYELGLISKLLGVVRRQFTLEGHNAELWDETARRFEHVAPLELELLPEDSMLREFYGGAADRRAQNADV